MTDRTPPSSPRAGRSTVSAAGELQLARCDTCGHLRGEHHRRWEQDYPDDLRRRCYHSNGGMVADCACREYVGREAEEVSTVSAAGEPRTDHTTRYLYQCPGCWSYGLWSIPIGGGRSTTDEGWIECECGERMFRIDLRNQEPSPYAEAAESRPSVTERPDLPHAAIKRAVEWVEENIAPKRCDNEGVSDCWRCTTVALARWLARAAASPAGPEAVLQSEPPGFREALADLLRKWDRWYLGDPSWDASHEAWNDNFIRLKDAVIRASETLSVAVPQSEPPDDLQLAVAAVFQDHHPKGEAACECGWRPNLSPATSHHEHLMLKALNVLGVTDE